MSEKDESDKIALAVFEDWHKAGVIVHEGPYLPNRTMVVSTDLMEHFKRLKTAELEKAHA